MTKNEELGKKFRQLAINYHLSMNAINAANDKRIRPSNYEQIKKDFVHSYQDIFDLVKEVYNESFVQRGDLQRDND